MTTTLDAAAAAKKPPTLAQILERAPTLTRATRHLEPLLFAEDDGAHVSPVTVLSLELTDGKRVPMTAKLRDDLLRALGTGALGYCELDVPMLAYEQKAGEDNRNFVCFRDASMRAIGKTGAGKPFLRDHSQRDSMARGGTLVESGTEAPTEGHYEIRQVARLTAPWAIDMYLRGNMTTVSIGWIPTGPVLCSVCNAPVGEKCGGWWKHWPGDRLKEVIDEETGEKSYVDSNKGSIVVRWIYTAAELIETSCVPVPGVPTAEMDPLGLGLRASLAADFPALAMRAAADEESGAAREPSGKSTPSPAASTVGSQPESTKMAEQPDQTPKLATLRKALLAALTMPEEHRAHAATLSAEEQEAFCTKSAADRQLDVDAALAADPIVFTGTLTGQKVRRSEGARMKELAELAEKTAASNKRHEEALAKQDAEREAAEVAAICQKQLAHLPGSDDAHVLIVSALRGSGAEPDKVADALRALAAASANIAKQAKAPGANLDEDAPDGDPQAQLDALIAKHAKEHKVDERTARLAVVKTPEGRRLYAETQKRH